MTNQWIEYVKLFKEKNPHLSHKEALQQASLSYHKRKKQVGGNPKDQEIVLINNDIAIYLAIHLEQRAKNIGKNNKLMFLDLNNRIHHVYIDSIETYESGLKCKFRDQSDNSHSFNIQYNDSDYELFLDGESYTIKGFSDEFLDNLHNYKELCEVLYLWSKTPYENQILMIQDNYNEYNLIVKKIVAYNNGHHIDMYFKYSEKGNYHLLKVEYYKSQYFLTLDGKFYEIKNFQKIINR